MIEFEVQCKPEPQGSYRAFVVNGRAVVTSTNVRLKAYREQVAAVARMHTGQLIARPTAVRLTVGFYFVKPKSAKKRTDHTVKPDCDKLLRGLCDALTGVCWEDDSQVTEIFAGKLYSNWEGVRVRVEAIAAM